MVANQASLDALNLLGSWLEIGLRHHYIKIM